jgi:hypothetical protein
VIPTIVEIGARTGPEAPASAKGHKNMASASPISATMSTVPPENGSCLASGVRAGSNACLVDMHPRKQLQLAHGNRSSHSRGGAMTVQLGSPLRGVAWNCRLSWPGSGQSDAHDSNDQYAD